MIILLIPLCAMQFSEDVSWSLLDFLIGGVLLGFTFLMFTVVYSKFNNSKYRWPICIAIILTFLMIWAELAVGIFGTPFAGG